MRPIDIVVGASAILALAVVVLPACAERIAVHRRARRFQKARLKAASEQARGYLETGWPRELALMESARMYCMPVAKIEAELRKDAA